MKEAYRRNGFKSVSYCGVSQPSVNLTFSHLRVREMHVTACVSQSVSRWTCQSPLTCFSRTHVMCLSQSGSYAVSFWGCRGRFLSSACDSEFQSASHSVSQSYFDVCVVGMWQRVSVSHAVSQSLSVTRGRGRGRRRLQVTTCVNQSVSQGMSRLWRFFAFACDVSDSHSVSQPFSQSLYEVIV